MQKIRVMFVDDHQILIVADINLPEMSGIEFSRILHQTYPGIKILALSMYGEKGMISGMLDAGVSGYILKNTGKQELVDAILKIYEGGLFFGAEVSAEMMKNFAEKKQLGIEGKKANLSPREKEIIHTSIRPPFSACNT